MPAPSTRISFWLDWQRFNRCMLLLTALAAAVYIGNAWSPSSYGHVFKTLGLGLEPDWGRARAIRSDEWSVVTPLTQASVNNGFSRYNDTSLYREDLRINYSLPLWDWGLVFKPTQWLFHVVDPAYAYSAHFFLLSALFVFGYALLMRQMGGTPLEAYLFSTSLYFTGVVQFWWNEKGPIFAIFPWLFLVLCTRWRWSLRLLAFYWVASCWFLENFYPPLFVSLAFVALVILLAYRPDLLRGGRWLGLLAVALLASATACAYLWDYLIATATTVYPGQRLSSGGGISWMHVASQLWPAALFSSKYDVGFLNVCELGVVGSYFLLPALTCLNWAYWRRRWSWQQDHRLLLLIAASALCLAWLVLPVPSWAGRLLLWDRVPPNRMWFAAGLLLLLTLFEAVRQAGLRFDRTRLAVFVVVWIGGWLYYHQALAALPGRWQDERWLDIAALLLIAPAWAVHRRHPQAAPMALLALATLANALVFGRFNPLQSAVPIFHLPPLGVAGKALDASVDEHGVLVGQWEGLVGATHNGLGYKSVAHLTAVPQLAYWRERFPAMPESEFMTLFNRYSHLVVGRDWQPRLWQADAISLPPSAVRAMPALLQGPPPERAVFGGHIDAIDADGEWLRISGWAPWRARGAARQLLIVGSPPGVAAAVQDHPRADVVAATGEPAFFLSGFELRIPHAAGSPPPRLCLFARDGEQAPWVRLHSSSDLPACDA